ncbi:hypothetical protein Tsubulata_031035 [Turnera subulata]|uniref:Uncharacterized protein n=1 Tax=Turnera subulata TaxID=218843 RepID=A0A9Q0GHH5_9ROSI|nr:hypothetical protein Tsubulata_031035 [Turnera subulata]
MDLSSTRKVDPRKGLRLIVILASATFFSPYKIWECLKRKFSAAVPKADDKVQLIICSASPILKTLGISIDHEPLHDVPPAATRKQVAQIKRIDPGCMAWLSKKSKNRQGNGTFSLPRRS